MLASNRRATLFAVLGLSVASLAGCGDANIRKLTPGIARDSVLKILAIGTAPDADTTPPNVYREERYLHNGHWISILLYTKTGKKERVETVPENELTPVVLLDDTLTGWGWEHHDSVALANKIAIKPRTR